MKTIRILFFLFAAIVLGVTTVSARCVIPGNPSQELSHADAVFAGTVLKQEYRTITDASDPFFGKERLNVILKLTNIWKGPNSLEIVLQTSSVKLGTGYTFENAEDYRFVTGESYLVYAFAQKGNWGTNGCTRTKKLSEAAKEIEELDQALQHREVTKDVGGIEIGSSYTELRSRFGRPVYLKKGGSNPCGAAKTVVGYPGISFTLDGNTRKDARVVFFQITSPKRKLTPGIVVGTSLENVRSIMRSSGVLTNRRDSQILTYFDGDGWVKFYFRRSKLIKIEKHEELC